MTTLTFLSLVFWDRVLGPLGATLALPMTLLLKALVRGVFELVGALGTVQVAPRRLLVLGALLDIALGWIFIANPGRAVVGIVWLLGVIAVAWGVAFLALGLIVRRKAAELPDAASA